MHTTKQMFGRALQQERRVTWYARTSSSSRMDSCMVWLLMAAAVMGAMLVLPCSKLWYASAIASPGTPFSVKGHVMR